VGLLSKISPFAIKNLLWPDVAFYDKQREIIRAVEDSDEVFCLSANKMGKDFIGAFIALCNFLRCIKLGLTCKIITTSVKDDHLKILWGEMRRFIDTAASPLRAEDGGPLLVQEREIRHATEKGATKPLSYILRQVSETGEGMSGHHADYTMIIGDEASAINDLTYSGAQGWASQSFWITNANPCENFVRRACDGGDIKRDDGKRWFRRIVHLPAEASPNVRLALEEKARGLEPSNRILIPGVLAWDEGILGYCYRRQYWDAQRQCIGLDAKFYEGPELKLFPPEWLQAARKRLVNTNLQAKGIGVDTALGGDNTSMLAANETGVLEAVSWKSKNTAKIHMRVLEFAKKWRCNPENIVFDFGGGGQNSADLLRQMGFAVRSVSFGQGIVQELLRTGVKRPFGEKLDYREERFSYFNLLAQMYGEASLLLDPSGIGATVLPGLKAFALPTQFCDRELTPGQTSLCFQLSKMPRDCDEEGKLKLPPKNKPQGAPENKNKKYLVDIIGHSPDEADAFVLAVHGMLHQKRVMHAGVA
jgi:hypothetical protein